MRNDQESSSTTRFLKNGSKSHDLISKEAPRGKSVSTHRLPVEAESGNHWEYRPCDRRITNANPSGWLHRRLTHEDGDIVPWGAWRDTSGRSHASAPGYGRCHLRRIQSG